MRAYLDLLGIIPGKQRIEGNRRDGLFYGTIIVKIGNHELVGRIITQTQRPIGKWTSIGPDSFSLVYFNMYHNLNGLAVIKNGDYKDIYNYQNGVRQGDHFHFENLKIKTWTIYNQNWPSHIIEYDENEIGVQDFRTNEYTFWNEQKQISSKATFKDGKLASTIILFGTEISVNEFDHLVDQDQKWLSDDRSIDGIRKLILHLKE